MRLRESSVRTLKYWPISLNLVTYTISVGGAGDKGIRPIIITDQRNIGKHSNGNKTAEQGSGENSDNFLSISEIQPDKEIRMNTNYQKDY